MINISVNSWTKIAVQEIKVEASNIEIDMEMDR
jgi:hypothetical protein